MIAAAWRSLPPLISFFFFLIFFCIVCRRVCQEKRSRVVEMFPLKTNGMWVFCLQFWRCFFQPTPLQSVHLSSSKLLGEILSVCCCFRRLSVCLCLHFFCSCDHSGSPWALSDVWGDSLSTFPHVTMSTTRVGAFFKWKATLSVLLFLISFLIHPP